MGFSIRVCQQPSMATIIISASYFTECHKCFVFRCSGLIDAAPLKSGCCLECFSEHRVSSTLVWKGEGGGGGCHDRLAVGRQTASCHRSLLVDKLGALRALMEPFSDGQHSQRPPCWDLSRGAAACSYSQGRLMAPSVVEPGTASVGDGWLIDWLIGPPWEPNIRFYVGFSSLSLFE